MKNQGFGTDKLKSQSHLRDNIATWDTFYPHLNPGHFSSTRFGSRSSVVSTEHIALGPRTHSGTAQSASQLKFGGRWPTPIVPGAHPATRRQAVASGCPVLSPILPLVTFCSYTGALTPPPYTSVSSFVKEKNNIIAVRNKQELSSLQ